MLGEGEGEGGPGQGCNGWKARARAEATVTVSVAVKSLGDLKIPWLAPTSTTKGCPFNEAVGLEAIASNIT